jgi:ribosomal protein L11 methyltransferase
MTQLQRLEGENANFLDNKTLTKEYLEIEVVVSEAVSDQVSNFLIDLGSAGVWTKPQGDNLAVISYLSDKSESKVIRNSITRYLDELRKLGLNVGMGQVNLKEIKDTEWNEEWKKNFVPVFITDDIVVIPDWEKTSFPGKIVIRIKPGMAFGTGTHATTQLSMRALGKYIKSSDRVVDVGCGSGILSILSVKLGASFVLGLDIDQDAIENAAENLKLNLMENSVEIRQGTVCASLSDNPFDLAVANINKREIFESLDFIRMAVKDNGMLIFSGILQEEENDARRFLEEKNLKIIELTRQEEWIGIVCKKQ